MKNKVLSILFLLFLSLLSIKVNAQEVASRKGLFFSFAPTVGMEVVEFKHAGGGGQFRLGAGVTERTLLYGEGNFFYTTAGNINYFVGDLQPKVQHFIYEQFFFNFGFGLTISNLNSSQEARTTKPGFLTSAGMGYEFRSEKKFRVAPEMGVYYRRVGGINYITPIAMAHLIWYF